MIRFVLVLVASLGCSSNSQQRRAALPAPTPPTSIAPAVVTTETTTAAPANSEPLADDASDDDAAAEAIDEMGALEGSLEEHAVKGEGITVDVSWWTMTGSTHVASSLTITTARGKTQLGSTEPDEVNGEDGESLPLIEEIYSVGRDRWVLLGWSSYGSGMQTEHAWLVDGSRAPRVVDKLEWTTDRMHAGLALDPGKNKLRIGIPLPKVTAVRDDDGNVDRGLHAEEEWQLAHGKETWSLGKLSKLRASEAHLLTVQAYTPPFKASASEQGWSGRFVWFAVEKRFVRR